MSTENRGLCIASIWLPAFLSIVGVLTVPTVHAAERPDIVVADFEADSYAGWVTDGEAFGTVPARGTLPGQMAVSGFLGRGLVNSFNKGDGSTGTLTSPPLKIERPFINFLIGGGRHPGSLGIDLLINGHVVRTATGPNDKPGGTEQLDWAAWDVRELQGQSAVLRIVDQETGGWGHINVDQIVQSDRRQGVEPVRRELIADSHYLHLPVRQDAPLRRLRVMAGGRIVREFDIKLADGRRDYRVFLDIQPFLGQTLTLETELPAGSKALDQIMSDEWRPYVRWWYDEPGRPQFHFTSLRGWLNDPNGMVCFNGEYHLYYQHNPYGWEWGNMHWGHAVSRDLVHWTEQPIALYPKQYGDWCFSGSGIVDHHNISGFGLAGSPPLVIAFTSTGRGECIAFSNDHGQTWTEYDGNPVVRHAGRDPRLLWHAPTKRWLMAVYDETAGARAIAFHSSPDLKKWSFESRIDGFFECPELFELPVDGDPGRRLWLLFGADGEYRLGKFDGRRFEPESGKLRVWHGNFYASQTFSDVPDGRRIQIGWANGITFPGEPFNQQMTVPCELSLRTTSDGIRMLARPVAELASLRRKEHVFDRLDVHSGENLLVGPEGDLLEINTEIDVGDKGVFTLNVRGFPVKYNASKKTLDCGDLSAPLAPEGSVVRLRILLDRASIEVFGNDGRVAVSRGLAPGSIKAGLALSVSGPSPPIKIRSLRVHEIRSVFK
jgi:fructan beta-fructosidase